MPHFYGSIMKLALALLILSLPACSRTHPAGDCGTMDMDQA